MNTLLHRYSSNPSVVLRVAEADADIGGDTHGVFCCSAVFRQGRLLINSVHPAAMRLIHKSAASSPEHGNFSGRMAKGSKEPSQWRPQTSLSFPVRTLLRPVQPWETGDVSHSGSCQNLHESAAFIVDAFYNGGEERDVASLATKKIR